MQGTLYPDVIESCPPPGSGRKHSHTIKSHHNVGGLPKDLKFTLIEPLRELFKARPGGPAVRCPPHTTRCDASRSGLACAMQQGAVWVRAPGIPGACAA